MDSKEHHTDTYLVYLMKLQSLVERQRLGGLWERFIDQDCLRAPVGLQVRAYQLELQKFKLSLPVGYITNREFPCLAVDKTAVRIVPHTFETNFSNVTSLEVHFKIQNTEMFQKLWDMESFSNCLVTLEKGHLIVNVFIARGTFRSACFVHREPMPSQNVSYSQVSSSLLHELLRGRDLSL